MNTASTLLQILALSACFAVSAAGSTQMPGVRRAMQTMAGQGGRNGAADHAYTTDAIGDL